MDSFDFIAFVDCVDEYGPSFLYTEKIGVQIKGTNLLVIWDTPVGWSLIISKSLGFNFTGI